MKRWDLRVPLVLALIVAGVGGIGWLWFAALGQKSPLGFGLITLAYGAGAAILMSQVFRTVETGVAVESEDMINRQAATAYYERRKAQRIAELEADPDPRKRKYLKEARRGILSSDEQIAYDLDPRMTVTCEHLRPLESAMREAGIRLRPLGYYGDPAPSSVSCGSSLLIDDVRRQFALPEFVTYEEIQEFVHKAALLECTLCKSHMDLAAPTDRAVPTFPRQIG